MKAILLSVTLLAVSVTAQAIAPSSYVAHEWGTFTSVQGKDGVQMTWNPRIAVELPRFVYNWMADPLFGLYAKSGFVCRQRMETPVIYFYSDRPRTVDVAVDFPGGTITEWYPQSASRVAASQMPKKLRTPNEPALSWDKVHVLAAKSPELLPMDQSGSHYFSARETDSNLVQVSAAKGKTETEKFLFYRGVGNFEAPLTVKLESSDDRTLRVENHGAQEMTELYVLENTPSHRGWLKIERLSPNETRSISLTELTSVESCDALAKSMAEQVSQTLVRQGLFSREASAMVKTWEQTWFSEPGLRVLYPMSRENTDKVLPLHLSPAPAKLVRVMVGRAEIITPSQEDKIADAVHRYVMAGKDDATKAQIAEEVHGYGFGRFSEPIMKRTLADPARLKECSEYGSTPWLLLDQVSKMDERNLGDAVKKDS
jgi:hypothetical protein